MKTRIIGAYVLCFGLIACGGDGGDKDSLGLAEDTITLDIINDPPSHDAAYAKLNYHWNMLFINSGVPFVADADGTVIFSKWGDFYCSKDANRVAIQWDIRDGECRSYFSAGVQASKYSGVGSYVSEAVCGEAEGYDENACDRLQITDELDMSIIAPAKYRNACDLSWGEGAVGTWHPGSSKCALEITEDDGNWVVGQFDCTGEKRVGKLPEDAEDPNAGRVVKINYEYTGTFEYPRVNCVEPESPF